MSGMPQNTMINGLAQEASQDIYAAPWQMTGIQQHPQSSMHRQLPLRQVQPIQQPNISLKQEQQELIDHKPNLQKCQLIGQHDGSVNTQLHQMLPVQSNGSMSLHQSQQLDSQANLNMSSLQQQQLLETVPIVSNIPWMHMLKQIKAEVQHPLHDHQQWMDFMQPQSRHNQHQQSQQHIMAAFQSQSNQLQQELGMEQQPSVQQSLQTSTGMFLQQNNIDKQKEYTQAQCGLQEIPFSTTMDITAQTGHPGECYLQDELYDMIKSLKDQYFTELTDLYNEVSLKLQSHIPPQIPIDHYEEMKKSKLFLERALHFLEIKKGSIQPSLWENIPEYERQIINAISSQRRKPVHTQEEQFHQSSRQISNSNIPQQQQASPGSGDWQEELYQKVRNLKDQHFAELSHLCNKVAMKLEYVDSQMPSQKPTEHYEKMKHFKLMLERILHFLQINKGDILPALREKIPKYERQIISILNSQRKKPVQTQGHQQSHQSAWQAPRFNTSQQQQPSQVFVDATAQTGHPGTGDWQEDLYQMIKRLKDQHFSELSHLCSKVSRKLEYVDSQKPSQKPTQHYVKMKDFKETLERILHFLKINKGDILPALRRKIPKYERQIIHILNSQIKKPVQTQGQ